MNTNSIIHDIVFLFIECYNDEKSKKLENFLHDLSKSDDICKNYSEISKVIYSLDLKSLEKLEIFCGIASDDSVESFNFEGYLDSMELKDREKDNLQHFERHIVLSCLQRQYIDKITQDVSTDVDNAKSKVTRIYSEFVGILGVFTALSFALMGSVQVFGNILNNVGHPNQATVGYILAVAGVYLIVIYLVIMTMFIGMKKIFDIGKEYKFDCKFTATFTVICFIFIVVGSIMVMMY